LTNIFRFGTAIIILNICFIFSLFFNNSISNAIHEIFIHLKLLLFKHFLLLIPSFLIYCRIIIIFPCFFIVFFLVFLLYFETNIRGRVYLVGLHVFLLDIFLSFIMINVGVDLRKLKGVCSTTLNLREDLALVHLS
jgi:hypothetical protein